MFQGIPTWNSNCAKKILFQHTAFQTTDKMNEKPI